MNSTLHEPGRSPPPRGGRGYPKEIVPTASRVTAMLIIQFIAICGIRVRVIALLDGFKNDVHFIEERSKAASDKRDHRSHIHGRNQTSQGHIRHVSRLEAHALDVEIENESAR